MSFMGRVVGTVEVQSYDLAAYGREHATAVRLAANLAAVAVENVRLLEREREKEQRSAAQSGGLARSPAGWPRLQQLQTGSRLTDLALRHVEAGEGGKSELTKRLAKAGGSSFGRRGRTDGADRLQPPAAAQRRPSNTPHRPNSSGCCGASSRNVTIHFHPRRRARLRRRRQIEQVLVTWRRTRATPFRRARVVIGRESPRDATPSATIRRAGRYVLSGERHRNGNARGGAPARLEPFFTTRT